MRYFVIILFTVISLSSCKRTIPRTKENINNIGVTSDSKDKSIVIDSLILNNKPKKIKEFYKLNGYKTAWSSKSNRKKLIEYINKIDEEGLYPENYKLDTLQKINSSYEKYTETEKINSDFLFTNSFNKISSDLYFGQINPKEIYSYWDIKREKLDFATTLHLALNNRKIKGTLDDLLPNNSSYKGLKLALAELRKLPEYDFKTYKTKRKIKLGDSLPEIEELKKRLIYWGDLNDKETSAVFNKETQTALKRFQRRNGLEETGLLGTKTIKALNISKEKRIENVLLNMERWRWYPRELGTDYVLVNIPDYNLIVVSNGNTVQSHKIIVGKSARKTPIISSKFNELVVNPSWTVPPTILKNDLTPSAAKDSNYFKNRGFTIYDNKNKVVAAEDWDSKKSTSYRYVQKSGGSNPLGRIKFNFKNRHSVYLHDTNNTRNFNKINRGLSSGCVRVQNPFELADFLLKTEKSTYDKSKINDLVKSAKTKHIRLNSSVNVHLFYFTAWNSEEGIQFREDIYDWDKTLLSKLNKLKI